MRSKKDVEMLQNGIEDEYKSNSLVCLGDFDKLVAQKSAPMMEMNYAMIVDPNNPNKMTLMPKQSLLLGMLYFGKIDSNDPSLYYVFIPISELKAAFGVKEIKKNELMKWLTYLQSPCRIRGDKYRTVNYFTDSTIIYSEKGTMIGVRLACSPYAKEFIFNLSEHGYKYIKVFVSWLINLKSRYSYVLLDRIIKEYFSVWGYENGNYCEWTVSVDELRSILCTPDGCDWNYISDKVLKPSIKEINKFTGYELTIIKNTYSYVDKITIKIYKKYDPETIIEDIELKYPDIDTFDSYKSFMSYFNSLTAERRAEYEAVIQTNNANIKGVESIIRALTATLSLTYTPKQLSYIARLVRRCMRRDSRQAEEVGYDSMDLVEIIDVIKGYEEKAEMCSTGKKEYSKQNYVISCFETYVDTL